MIQIQLTWQQFKARYHPDTDKDHKLQKRADNEGAIELLHPTHDWVLERIEPDI